MKLTNCFNWKTTISFRFLLSQAENAQQDCVYLHCACLCCNTAVSSVHPVDQVNYWRFFLLIFFFAMCSLTSAAQMGLNVKDATNCWSSSLPGVTSEKLFSARHPPPQNPAATPLHITYSPQKARKGSRLSKCCSSPLIANVTGKKQKQLSAFFLHEKEDCKNKQQDLSWKLYWF